MLLPPCECISVGHAIPFSMGCHLPPCLYVWNDKRILVNSLKIFGIFLKENTIMVSSKSIILVILD